MCQFGGLNSIVLAFAQHVIQISSKKEDETREWKKNTDWELNYDWATVAPPATPMMTLMEKLTPANAHTAAKSITVVPSIDGWRAQRKGKKNKPQHRQQIIVQKKNVRSTKNRTNQRQKKRRRKKIIYKFII